jgi:hypothetical protein
MACVNVSDNFQAVSIAYLHHRVPSTLDVGTIAAAGNERRGAVRGLYSLQLRPSALRSVISSEEAADLVLQPALLQYPLDLGDLRSDRWFRQTHGDQTDWLRQPGERHASVRLQSATA